jgi:hypothetical protein
MGLTAPMRPRSRESGRARRRKRQVALLAASAVLAVALALVAWVGFRAFLARGELEGTIPLASRMQQEVILGDVDAARGTAAELSERAAAAVSLTSDPIWRMFEGIPALGTNLSVVRQLAAIVDDVAQEAIAPLAQVAGEISVDDFRPVDGKIDLEPLVQIQPTIAQAAQGIASSQAHARKVDTAGTIAVVAAAAGQLRSAIDGAALSITAVDKALRIVPAMLGVDGPRNYLLLVQNPAELRSSGGIVGAVAMIHTESGAIQLSQQASGASFPRYPEPVRELTAETRGLYGDITGQYMLNVGLTPSFPVSAGLAREMWRLEFGVEVDGVLSLDPIALSYILGATGPVTLPTGDVLSSDNAVSLLLTDVYARYQDPVEQDAFFAAAAASVFSAVASGNVDPVALITALGRAGAEHRARVWNADEGDQAVLSDTTLAGTLPTSDSGTQAFGLYLNDATGAKMDTYLDVATSVGQKTCRNDGRRNYLVEVTLTNIAPLDAGSVLPPYVTGDGVYGVTPGNIRTIVSLYGTSDLQNLGLTQDGQKVPFHPATDHGHQVSSLSVELSPGQSTVLTYGWLGDSSTQKDINLQMTPVIHRNETIKLDTPC